MFETNLAEPSVIGALIAPGTETKELAIRRLLPECFGDAALRGIFEACRELWEAGSPIDVVSVEAKVGKKMRPVLVDCIKLVPSLSELEVYIEIVREEWRKRLIQRATQEIALESDCATVSSKELLTKLEALIASQRKIEDTIADRFVKDFYDSGVEFYCDLGRPDTSLKTGWNRFDYVTGGLQRQAVYVIAARSGKGKSDLAINLATNLSSRYAAYYVTMEMTRKQVMSRIFSRITRINSIRLRDHNLTTQEFQVIRNALDIWKQNTHLMLDEQTRVTVEEVEGKIIKYRPDILFIDHLGLMTHDVRKQNQWEAIGATTQRLKELAMKYNIAVVELVQLNREADRTKSTPTMSQLKGSSNIENDADGIFSIDAPEASGILKGDDYRPVTLHILKNRHGSTGRLYFNWMPQYHKWVEVDNRLER